MNRPLLVLALVALPAFADVPPMETEPCVNKAAGAECVTWDTKKPGTCVEKTFEPPEFKKAYGAKPYKALACEPVKAPQKGKKSSSAPSPWLGFALSFVAVAGALAARKS